MSSLDDIERQATEAMNKSKATNSKIMGDTGKSITDMTKTALTSVTTAATTTPTGGSSGVPVSSGPVAGSIKAMAVFDINSQINANMSIKIYGLLEAWSRATANNPAIYLDSDRINDKLKESIRSTRAMYVVG
jgi:hypothetical protein